MCYIVLRRRGLAKGANSDDGVSGESHRNLRASAGDACVPRAINIIVYLTWGEKKKKKKKKQKKKGNRRVGAETDARSFRFTVLCVSGESYRASFHVLATHTEFDIDRSNVKIRNKNKKR